MQSIEYIRERIAEKRKLGKPAMWLDVYMGIINDPETANLFVRIEHEHLEEQLDRMIAANPGRVFTIYIRLKNTPRSSSERLIFTPENTPVNGISFTDQKHVDIDQLVQDKFEQMMAKKSQEDRIKELEEKLREANEPNKMFMDLMEKLLVKFEARTINKGNPVIQGTRTDAPTNKNAMPANDELNLEDDTVEAISDLIEMFSEPGIVKLVAFLKANPDYVTLVKSKI